MASLISSAVPVSNLELIRNQIAAILAVELPVQYSLDNTLPQVQRVWVERTIPPDNIEIALVNVGVDMATWLDHTQPSVKGEYVFNIDIYNNAVATGTGVTETGDVRAMIKLERLVMVIRGILQAPVYNTLGFNPGKIGGVYVQSAQVGRRNASNNYSGDKDGAHDVVAQIKLMVRSAESNLITATAVPLQINTTSITENEKGFYYEFNPVA